MLAGASSALRLPVGGRVISQRVASNLALAQTASPFALSQSFSSDVFSQTCGSSSTLSLVWEGVEAHVIEALLATALSGSFAELSVVAYRHTSNSVRVRVRGAKATCAEFLQFAATRDLEVAAAVWS